MKNVEKDIEKKLQEQFDRQDFEIQDAWLEDMSSKIDKYNKKDNKKFFFWLFGGLFLMSIGGGLVWSQLSNNKGTSLVTLKNFKEIEKKSVNSTTSSINKFIYEELPCKPHEFLNEESTAKENNLNNSTKHYKTTQKNKLKNPSLKKENVFKPNQKFSKQKDKNLPNANSLLVANQLKIGAITTSKELKKYEDDQKESDSLKDDKEKEQAIISSLRTDEILNEKESLENNNENTSNVIEQKDTLENLFNEELTLKDSIQKLDDAKDEKQETQKELGLSLALNAGPSFLFRTYNSDTQNEKRANEEKNKVAWNLNLELYKKFKNNFILGTGVNITNYGEKINYSPVIENLRDTTYQAEAKDYFNLNISKVGQSIMYDTTTIIYYDTITIIKDSIYKNTAIQKGNGNTNFTFIEIPILFGYQILNTNNWKLTATTGFSAGFLIFSKGNYINTENNLDPVLNNKVLFNYLLSAQLNYKVYKNISLNLAPNFKYNLNNQSMYHATRKRYVNFGINAGISLDF